MLKRIATGLVLALLVALPVTAQDFETGLAAYKLGDYTTALREWRPLAEQGIGQAQTNLGVIYYKGQGVARDYAQARRWFLKAAQQGRAIVQMKLGLMYELGHGVPQDYTEALKWGRKAAEQGQVNAQVSLGLAYLKGRGVQQDYVVAHMWFSLAAANGYKVGRKGRDKIAKSMTPVQIAKAQKMAREWRAKHKKK